MCPSRTRSGWISNPIAAHGPWNVAVDSSKVKREALPMTMKLELTPELQAGLLVQAQRNGLSLEAYARQVLLERVRQTSTPALSRSQIAGQRIRELRKGATLGGISTRELIEEGRD